MLLPATRRRLRAIPYPSVNPSANPPPPTAPPPPPPPSLLLRWDAESCPDRPQERCADDLHLIPAPRQQFSRNRVGECVEGYVTAVPPPGHFRAGESPWNGTDLQCHAPSPHPKTLRDDLTSTSTPSSATCSTSEAFRPHLSSHPASSSRQLHYRQPIPDTSLESTPSTTQRCSNDPSDSPGTRKAGVDVENSSRTRGQVSVNAHERVSDSRRESASSKSRGGQHGLLASFLFTLVAASSMWRHCAALCPPRCQCDDLTLSATCTDAALEVIPIQLNPEVKWKQSPRRQ
ncbi:hypothetical protein J437_LFUL005393 [Ladona fulva]|uniref:Uncharacterized protein n=1 Tax=Ladona fulva TaxID=123851 RepID=A0A8K0NZQ4_LADFU|nr:hypothetical protein J437_LFUL005393 [Ladona fulva]